MCIVDPVIQGPAGTRFSHATISYFLGTYDELVIPEEKTDDEKDKKHIMREVAAEADKQYLPAMRKDGPTENLNEQRWEADGEFMVCVYCKIFVRKRQQCAVRRAYFYL